jgi:hypothetical protein
MVTLPFNILLIGVVNHGSIETTLSGSNKACLPLQDSAAHQSRLQRILFYKQYIAIHELIPNVGVFCGCEKSRQGGFVASSCWRLAGPLLVRFPVSLSAVKAQYTLLYSPQDRQESQPHRVCCLMLPLLGLPTGGAGCWRLRCCGAIAVAFYILSSPTLPSPDSTARQIRRPKSLLDQPQMDVSSNRHALAYTSIFDGFLS